MKATSSNDETLLHTGVVLFLAFALVFWSSDLFAQTDYPKELAKKGQNTRTHAVESAIKQASPVPGIDSALGSDSSPGLFVSPAMPDFIVWGSGSICKLPTAKEVMLGSNNWGANPAVVVFTIQGPWVLGAMVKEPLSQDDSNDSTSFSSFVQPFVHYDFSGGWYVNAVPALTGEMCYAKHLALPVGPSIGKVQCFGETPVNMQLGAYYNAEKTQDGPGWQVNFQLQILFPQ